MNPVTTPEKEITSKTARQNPLLDLQKLGQSVWLDYIRRNLITSGELQRLITDDGLRGITSNPSIFEKAIAGSTDYADFLQQLVSQGLSTGDIYERIAVRDIQDAADRLRPVYEATNKADGYVSLEVSPTLARNTQATIEEARRLWKTVGRPNIMIKVPGTIEGVAPVRQLTSEGINVNITLLFSQEAYVRVADAYREGLEARLKAGNDISHVASVASFFVSRIDALVDSIIHKRLQSPASPQEQQLLSSLLGKVAIANAKQAYRKYEDMIAQPNWKALAERGAQVQRLLWASTSTKDPNYSDVLYIENLIGADTVNTIPPATMDAFREHGRVARTIDADLEQADRTMADLGRAGISMEKVTGQLLDEAIKLFEEAFKKLLGAIDQKKTQPTLNKPKIEFHYQDLPSGLKQAVDATLQDWKTNDKVSRLWKGDASVWTGNDESKWLGWLRVAQEQVAELSKLNALAQAGTKFRDAVVLGMGGSSLCPEVLRATFGKLPGHPELHVLDSTSPEQIKALESKLDLAQTLFIVSSKSGSTLEPNIFKQYFYSRVEAAVGKEKAGEHFVAVTDPGSQMEQVAQNGRFRSIFFGVPSIGGRYSALSNFGLVPAAVMGLDVQRFLDRTLVMVEACAASVPAEQDPAAVLGAVLGTLGNLGRNKVTIVASPAIHDLGAWLEQLIAESTGKIGKGLVPVDREALGAPETYGNDRLFVYLRLRSAIDTNQDSQIDALRKANQPVVRIDIADIYDLGQEFFRWEFATAVAGSILGINPFDQPDVEASKIATRQLTQEYEKTGKFPDEPVLLEENGIKLYTDQANAARLKELAAGKLSLSGVLRAHLGQLKIGDYFALLAFIEMNEANEAALQNMRHSVRDKKHVATCLGFGPRFLHSTGQAYKGGPNTGVFLQITSDHAADLPVPGQKYTFGTVIAAQARGDFAVLTERKRRALRVHLPADVKSGLALLRRALAEAI